MRREQEEKITSKYDAKLEKLRQRIETKKAQIEKTITEINSLKAELGVAGLSALASLTRLTSALTKASRIQSLKRRISAKEATLRKYQKELETLQREYTKNIQQKNQRTKTSHTKTRSRTRDKNNKN